MQSDFSMQMADAPLDDLLVVDHLFQRKMTFFVSGRYYFELACKELSADLDPTIYQQNDWHSLAHSHTSRLLVP